MLDDLFADYHFWGLPGVEGVSNDASQFSRWNWHQNGIKNHKESDKKSSNIPYKVEDIISLTLSHWHLIRGTDLVAHKFVLFWVVIPKTRKGRPSIQWDIVPLHYPRIDPRGFIHNHVLLYRNIYPRRLLRIKLPIHDNRFFNDSVLSILVQIKALPVLQYDYVWLPEIIYRFLQPPSHTVFVP